VPRLLRSRGFPLLLLLPAGGTLAAAPPAATLSEKVRHQVELFAELAPGDSIAALRRASADTLELDVFKAGRGPARTTRHFVPPATLEKILAAWDAPGRDEPRRHEPERPRIREDYMSGQLTASTYVYGVALVNALNLQGATVVLIPAFAVTGSLIGHAAFSLNNPLDEAQVLGMNYAAGSAIVTSYALPFLALGTTGGAFRLGSTVSLAAYPLSLAPGYRYGSRFSDRPGDLSKKISAAGVFAAAGAVSPWVYLGPDNGDLRGRLAAGQILAFGTIGHFAADHYRPGETLTEGVTTGIGIHTALATVAGFALASSQENPQVKTGLVLGSALAGFGEGLLFFRHRNDDADQGNYSGLGMGGGMMLAAAVSLATTANTTQTLWGMTGGGLAGYALTYNAMDNRRAGRQRRADAGIRDDDFIRGVTLAFAPVPELTRRAPGERVETRYRVPGVVVKF
jgi:hypothetical protein